MKNFINDLVRIENINGIHFCTSLNYITETFLKFANELAEQKPELNTEIEVYKVGKMPFEKLPEDVQAEVKSVLKAFDCCNVVYEYGAFHSSVNACIKSDYNHDHFVCGRYLASEIYTPEERRQNYIELYG